MFRLPELGLISGAVGVLVTLLIRGGLLMCLLCTQGCFAGGRISLSWAPIETSELVEKSTRNSVQDWIESLWSKDSKEQAK